MDDPKITMETVRTALTLLEESKTYKTSKGRIRIAVLNAVEDAVEFEKIERALRAINERECNGYMNERTWKEDEAAKLRDERREVKLRDKATALAKRLGLKIHFNGDPRGAAIKIHTPRTGAYNSFGGAEDGWCV